MPNREDYLSLRERAIALIINVLILYIFFVLASSQFRLTGGIESVWLISALAMWFLTLLTAPWFLPPRDILSNAVTVTVILVTLDLSPVPQFRSELEIFRWIACTYSAFVAGVALAALFLHDRVDRNDLGRLIFQISGTLGRGELLYSPPAIISIIGAYQQNFATIGWLLFVWLFISLVKPVERIALFIKLWPTRSTSEPQLELAGTIDRIDYPNIIRVRLNSGAAWEPSTLHIAAMPDGDQQFVLALFKQVQGTDVIGTGLCVAPLADRRADLPIGAVCISHDTDKTAVFLQNLSGRQGAELIGFTVENSTIGLIRFEVAGTSDLSEGQVVFARISGREVFYQILDAETSEESFDQNPRGTHIVRAAQLGCYSPETGFTKFPWLPTMNTPLFSAKNISFPPAHLSERDFIVGEVPSTDLKVVADIDHLVQYHTAILGVTGTGKTELALDIVREAVAKGIKVFCVDFTGEYKHRLADLNPQFPSPTPEEVEDLEAKIFDVETGKYGAKDEKAAYKKTLDALRRQVSNQIDSFLRETSDQLAVFELSEIANTKATLRLTELYLSSIMNWARHHRGARQILIVLEEAHTIVPETAGAGFDYDTQWVVSRIGQIALQGRKYGVGLLVITQRTALVSKTILSQCNTFFTHTLIDQTSLNFLDSVYSHQHSRLIPNLGRFEFLAFGKALRTERPVLLRRPFDPRKKEASEALRRPLEAEVDIQAKAYEV